MKASTTLINPQQARDAFASMYRQALPMVESGGRLVLTLEEWTRSHEQNRTYHGLLQGLAADVLWAGKRWAVPQWKVLTVSGHAVATGQGSEVVPGLEGEFVNLRESTARMGVKRMSSLIDYTMAFCAAQGVQVAD